jgi:predicted ArsR family transcriptional regulator
MMQKTRQKIIEYLRQHGEATVDELSEALDSLTAVTVRHHLDILRGEGLVAPPEARHRTSPGRPKYVYRLTAKAESLFPDNLRVLTDTMLAELKSTLNPEQINVFFDGVAERMAQTAGPGDPHETLEQRLDRVVEHLTGHGYEANWEKTRRGYVLHTSNCPYSSVVERHDHLCHLDARYIGRLLGATPERLSHLRQNGDSCSYLVSPS